jgi:hypothetical protein
VKVEEVEFQCVRTVFSSDGDECVEDAFERLGGT